MIPTVSPKLLIFAHQKVAEDHEAGLDPDPTVSIVSVLHGRCSVKQMMAIEHRLFALAHLVMDGGSKGWTINREGKDYTLVSTVLLKAAAAAPLAEATTIGDLRFGPELLELALREAEPEGNA